MTTPPFDVQFRTAPTPGRTLSSRSLGFVLPKTSEVPSETELTTLYDITSDSVADTVLGTTGPARAIYNHAEARAAIHFSACFYDEGAAVGNAQDKAVNDCIDQYGNVNSVSTRLAGITPEMVVIPGVTGEAAGAASAIAAHAEVVADKAKFIAVTDATKDASPAVAVTWANNNSGPRLYRIGNYLDITGYPNAPGSIVFAAHWAAYATPGIGINPFGLQYPILGASNPTPVRPYSFTDGTADGNVMQAAGISVATNAEGVFFFTEGDLTQGASNDPRNILGNAFLADAIVRDAQRIMIGEIGQTADADLLTALGVTVGETLEHYVLDGFVADITVADATFANRRISLPLEVQFLETVRSVRLIATITV